MTRILLLLCCPIFILGCYQPEEFSMAPQYIQSFTIMGGQETALTTQSGALLFVPACAFNTSEAIEIQLVEAYNIADFEALQLTTQTKEEKLLASAGMFYFNATDKTGNPLTIQQECAPLLRYSTQAVLPNAQLFIGERLNGQVIWNDQSHPLIHYLVNVPLSELNFRAQSVYAKNNSQHTEYQPPEARPMQAAYDYCGIDDKIIEQLYAKPFAKTFIATLEFEERIHHLHKGCSDEGLTIYLKHLQEPLYVSDSLVYELLKSDQPTIAQNFRCFYLQKKTNVKDPTTLPAGYHKRWKAFLDQNRKASEQTDSRLFSTFPLKLTDSWYNVDRVLSDGMEAQRFLDKVSLTSPHLSAEELKRLPVLCVSGNTNAVQRLNYSESLDAHTMNGLWAYTTDHRFTLLAYAQKGENVFFGQKDILLGRQEQLHQIILKPTTLNVVRGILSKYGNPRPEHELNDLYNHINPCCHARYPSDVGM